MKKPARLGKSPLVLHREHLRVLTPTDLQQVVGGERPTQSPTISDNCSNRVDDTCRFAK